MPKTKHFPPLPELETLHERPSWVTWGGRVDRSACIEVRVSEIRPLCKQNQFKPARTFAGREAVAHYTIHTKDLVRLHNKRTPRQLQGDFRWKSHAMQPQKHLGWDRNNRFKKSLKSLGTPNVRYHNNLPPNPNKGATCCKMLGFHWEWSQKLTVERWRIGEISPDAKMPPNLEASPKFDRILRRYYLVCPGRSAITIPIWRPDPDRVAPTPRQREWWSLDREPWRQPCTGKCYKLFAPMCMHEELRDSLIAHDWLQTVQEIRKTNSHTPDAQTQKNVALLIDRYAILFHPRTLLCQRCLGLHYGKVNFKKRRFPKPDLFEP